MRKLTLIALALGAPPSWPPVAAAHRRPHRQALATHRDHREGAGLPGRHPAGGPDQYQITFNADGTFTGTADCNQIAGTYKTRGSNKITITPGISTMALCPDGSFDTLFVHGLSQAVTLGHRGRRPHDHAHQRRHDDLRGGQGAPAPLRRPPRLQQPRRPPSRPPPRPPSRRRPRRPAHAKPTAAPTAAPGATPAPTPAAGLIGKAWQLTAITRRSRRTRVSSRMPSSRTTPSNSRPTIRSPPRPTAIRSRVRTPPPIRPPRPVTSRSSSGRRHSSPAPTAPSPTCTSSP